jgi:hypothetical protein
MTIQGSERIVANVGDDQPARAACAGKRADRGDSRNGAGSAVSKEAYWAAAASMQPHLRPRRPRRQLDPRFAVGSLPMLTCG